MTVEVTMSEALGSEEAEMLGFDLIAYIPREEVSDLHTSLPILRSEKLCVEMFNLAYLRLVDVDLSTLFVELDAHGPHTSTDLLRSLDSVRIIRPALRGGDWSPLVDFFTRRAAAGNRVSSLRLSGLRYTDKDVAQSILPMAKDFGGTDSEEDLSWY